MKSVILILTIPFFLISCIEVRDADEKKDPINIELKPPTVTVEPLEMAHKYLVTVKGNGSMTKIMRRPVGFFSQTSSPALAEEVIDKPGQYEYSVQQDNHTYLLQVEIPEDFVVEGDMKIKQLPLLIGHENDKFRTAQVSGRFFFKASSSITTDGENLLIKCASIESEGGSVQTFPRKLKAATAKAGRHGGNIKIETNNLRGSLHFIMRGEDGGDGELIQTGPLHLIKNDGGKGGNSGLLQFVIADKSKASLTFDLLPGDGGEGREVIRVCIAQGCENKLVKAKGQNGDRGIAEQPLGVR